MDKNNLRHLLVIRFSALGDVAMTVPVIKALTEQYPEIQVTILTRPFFKPLFDGIDNTTVYEADVNDRYKGVIGLWRLYSDLKGRGYDAVADLHNVLRTKILKRYFSLTKIPFIQIDKGRGEKKALTRPYNKLFVPLKTTAERYADVFRELGFELDLQNTQAKPRIDLPASLITRFGRDKCKWIGVAPFAAFKGKMYPIDKMEEAIRTLDQREDYRIFLFGAGQKENTILTPISKKYKNVINMVGALKLEEELALISNLDVMISMDSANGHLAAIFGVPTVTIWGVTHPYAGFYPFGQDPDNALLANRDEYPQIPTSVYGNRLPKGYEKAIATTTPQQIISKIIAVLGRE